MWKASQTEIVPATRRDRSSGETRSDTCPDSVAGLNRQCLEAARKNAANGCSEPCVGTPGE